MIMYHVHERRAAGQSSRQLSRMFLPQAQNKHFYALKPRLNPIIKFKPARNHK